MVPVLGVLRFARWRLTSTFATKWLLSNGVVLLGLNGLKRSAAQRRSSTTGDKKVQRNKMVFLMSVGPFYQVLYCNVPSSLPACTSLSPPFSSSSHHPRDPPAIRSLCGVHMCHLCCTQCFFVKFVVELHFIALVVLDVSMTVHPQVLLLCLSTSSPA